MRLTTILKLAIMLFILCSFGTGDFMTGRFVSAAEKGEGRDHYIQVYYFHGKVRCYSCNMIEKMTVETIRTFFSEELDKGRLKLSVVNVSTPENSHFVKDYGLYSQSVILSEMKDGKQASWKNLIRVWELLNNEQKFKEYVREEVTNFLEKTDE